jgi:hypothetical protein
MAGQHHVPMQACVEMLAGWGKGCALTCPGVFAPQPGCCQGAARAARAAHRTIAARGHASLAWRLPAAQLGLLLARLTKSVPLLTCLPSVEPTRHCERLLRTVAPSGRVLLALHTRLDRDIPAASLAGCDACV